MPLAVAAVIGGVTGYVVVDDFVMQRPRQVSEARAKAQTRQMRDSESVAKQGRTARRIEAQQGIRWIAEPKVGPYRRQPFRVAGVRADGSVETQTLDPGVARRGLRTAFARSLRKWGKAPKEDRDSWLRRYTGGGSDEAKGSGYSCGASNKEDEGPLIYPGDVFLDGIPMVDQGRAAFCAVASAARVLQGYGIEVTMEDMAVLANSSETGGTNRSQWDQALRQVAGEHGLELKTVTEVTDAAHSIPSLVEEYNAYADDMGYNMLNASDYVMSIGRFSILNYTAFSEDREYPVQREVMLSDDAREGAFNDNVIGRINDSDPLFWCVTLGDVPEEIPGSSVKVKNYERGGHMRLIIGYNEDRGEVLYSDSWGEGHELKRMDGRDALSITTGMYYLTDK